MGILRTDKISGLETPTAVTGSVVFDGTGDYVTSSAFHIADSWTMEFWFNTSVNNAAQRPMNFSNNLNASNYAYIELTSSGKIKARVAGAAAFGDIPVVSVNEWHHTALSYDGSTAYFVYDGNLIATQSVSYSNHSIQVRFGADESNASTNLYTGYVSNARIVSGEALYTTDYTVPIHAFEVTDGTNLLCFNNADSAAASEHGRIGAAPPTLTVTGDAAGSTVSPGLTRDFTSGTEFRGVTTFDTQGYFVPPSGTTEQRGNDRGVFGGGENPGVNNVIQFVNTSSSGTSQDFGDLVRTQMDMGATGSQTRGLFAGGDASTAPLVEENTIQFITIASTGNALDFGDLTGRRRLVMGGGTNTRGVFGGGSNGSDHQNNIDYVTIASLGNAQNFGDLDKKPGERGASQVTGSPTRGIFYVKDNSINYITWATTGNAIDFGDTDVDSGGAGAVGDKTRSCMHGSTVGYNNSIEYITISTLGNGQDFGDLTETMRYQYGASNPTRGVMAGDSNDFNNTINFITIQTTGNAKNFGDLSTGQQRGIGLSGCHGGIS